MRRRLIPAIVSVIALISLPQCIRKPILPDYEPLCTTMRPGVDFFRDLPPTDPRRQYYVGPKGGVYYINANNKKVYIKSTQQPYTRPKKQP